MGQQASPDGILLTSSPWVGPGSGPALCPSEMLTHRFNQSQVFTVCSDGEVQGFPGGGGGVARARAAHLPLAVLR